MLRSDLRRIFNISLRDRSYVSLIRSQIIFIFSVAVKIQLSSGLK